MVLSYCSIRIFPWVLAWAALPPSLLLFWVALTKCRRDQWSQYEIAEIAFQAERLHLGIAGGWQDQYASVFGGFNFIEFHADENIVNPIRVHPDVVSELEECLVLCDTGIGHHSGNIHEDQKRDYVLCGCQGNGRF